MYHYEEPPYNYQSSKYKIKEKQLPIKEPSLFSSSLMWICYPKKVGDGSKICIFNSKESADEYAQINDMNVTKIRTGQSLREAVDMSKSYI